jgi:hypothetical protein
MDETTPLPALWEVEGGRWECDVVEPGEAMSV